MLNNGKSIASCGVVMSRNTDYVVVYKLGVYYRPLESPLCVYGSVSACPGPETQPLPSRRLTHVPTHHDYT